MNLHRIGHAERECPVCGGIVGTTDGCPCCEQWRDGIDTNGKPRNQKENR